MALLMSNQPMHGCGAGCEFSASYYRAANQWSSEPSLGAQVFFGARGSESHTGMVVGYVYTHVYTVEGNTGYSAGYSGGAVLERTYSRGDSRIVGYGVPRWSVAGGSEPVVDVSNVWRDAGELEVDGWLGVQSVTAWQEALGTHADGFVSGQDWADWGCVPKLVAVESTRKVYGCGEVAHDSPAPTYTYDGEIVRWYVLQDPQEPAPRSCAGPRMMAQPPALKPPPPTRERGSRMSFPSTREAPQKGAILPFGTPLKSPLYIELFGEGDVCRDKGFPTTHPHALPMGLGGTKAFDPLLAPEGFWCWS